MFRLPVCPYCHTVYRYGDVRKISKKKQEKCYHCKNDFRVSKGSVWVLLLIVVVLAVAVNIFELYAFANVSFMAIFVTNIAMVLLSVAFVPFFIKFKK